MTRGTAILIDEKKVNVGPEFNGDMYPHGHGDEFLQGLSEVKNNTEFIIFNNRFNKYNHGYDKIMSYYQGQFDHEVFKDGNIFDANKITNQIISDWVFIKNATDKTIKVKVNDENRQSRNMNIRPNETIRLYFGKFFFRERGHRIMKK